MKILIIGAGRAGLEVATHLTRIGHAVTIVDNDLLGPGLSAPGYSGIYLRAKPEDLSVLDGPDDRQRAELIAERLSRWKSTTNA